MSRDAQLHSRINVLRSKYKLYSLNNGNITLLTVTRERFRHAIRSRVILQVFDSTDRSFHSTYTKSTETNVVKRTYKGSSSISSDIKTACTTNTAITITSWRLLRYSDILETKSKDSIKLIIIQKIFHHNIPIISHHRQSFS